jgi:hypothetical protein
VPTFALTREGVLLDQVHLHGRGHGGRKPEAGLGKEAVDEARWYGIFVRAGSSPARWADRDRVR